MLFKFKRNTRSEIEEIVDDLICDALGKDIFYNNFNMNKWFERRTEGFNSDTNPLGKEEAVKIINEMLAIIASERSLLASRIEASVARGDLYKRYAKRQRAVERFSIKVVAKKQHMLAAQTDYLYHKKIYDELYARLLREDISHHISQDDSGADEESVDEEFENSQEEYHNNKAESDIKKDMDEEKGEKKA